MRSYFISIDDFSMILLGVTSITTATFFVILELRKIFFASFWDNLINSIVCLINSIRLQILGQQKYNMLVPTNFTIQKI